MINETTSGTAWGTATITVTSDGYLGVSNNFAQGGSESEPAIAQVPVNPEPATVVQILLNGNLIAASNNPNLPPAPVVIGQQIVLTGVVMMNNSQVVPNSQQWGQPHRHHRRGLHYRI